MFCEKQLRLSIKRNNFRTLELPLTLTWRPSWQASFVCPELCWRRYWSASSLGSSWWPHRRLSWLSQWCR